MKCVHFTSSQIRDTNPDGSINPSLPEDIYAAVDSCETAQEIWLQVQQMMKGSDIGIQKKNSQYNQKEVDELKAERLEKTQDPLALMANSNNPYNAVQNLRVQNVGNQNGLISVQGNGNQNQIGNGIQLQAEEYDLMAAAADLDEIEEVNANCILMANLQQASTSGTQTDNAPIYDSDGSAEYIELLKPIPDSHQVPQTDNDVISEDTSMEQGGETVEQHPVNFEETRALYESLYQNLEIKVEKVNSVNRKYPNPLSQKLENKNVELEFQVLNYARENAYLKVTYKNLFDSISVSRAQTKTIIASLQNELQSNIYKNAKHRTQMFKKVSDQKDNSLVTSANTKFAKQPIVENLPKIGETNALSNPVTSNSVSTPQESKSMNNDKEEPKFVGDFKSLANEADASLFKHKALELEIERLLKVVKLENKNVELEFHVLNYARENAYLKVTYKNLFDSISVSRAQTKTIIASLQNELQSNIYKNAKLRTQMFKKVSDQKDNTLVTSANTKFAKQPIVENLPTVGKTNALSNPVTSNSISTPQELKKVNNDKVIAPGMFRINPSKTSREEKQVPNTLFKKVSDQKDNTLLTSENTKFAKQPTMENLPKVGKTYALSKPVTSNSVSTPQESKGVNNDKVIATACFTQNRSIIHRRFNKTPYELINARKPDISFLYVFGALCYPKNDREDIGKLGAKVDIGFFIRYSADSCAYRVYNRRIKKIIETMNVLFDELSAMAFEQRSSKPELNSELGLLFEAMYDDYIGGQPSATARTVPPTQEHQDVDELNPNAMVDGNTFVNSFVNSSTSAAASSS
nr:retrovirus-related Pol polyprotein from transposon TNT 1-94 [Tanacetum cinerariifolium]